MHMDRFPPPGDEKESDRVKITEIETIVVGSRMEGAGRLTDRNFTYVLVHTDEGITGLGEATLEGHDNAVLGMIADLTQLVIGEDPRRVAYLTEVMMRQKFWGGGAIKGSAVAGIELALWDILGRSVGQPVHQLVGGAVRDRIRYYLNGWAAGALEPSAIAEKAAGALEAGHRAFKFSLAVPSWSVHDRELVQQLDAVLDAIRGQIGDLPLMYDGHGRYDAELAIALAEPLAAHHCMFFEEPVLPDRVRDMAKVARGSRLPIAAGERLVQKEQFIDFLQVDAFSIAQPDLAHCHGFGEGLKIAALAAGFGAGIAPHGPMSPVLTAISLHFDAVVPNFVIQERLQMGAWCESLITTPLKMSEGFLSIPGGPGWGIELDLDVCRAHPPIDVAIPRMFRADGGVADW